MLFINVETLHESGLGLIKVIRVSCFLSEKLEKYVNRGL